MSQVVVVIGGGSLVARAVIEVQPGVTVIAADSGLDHAVAAGLSPDVLVGDLDSISAAGRMWAYAHDVLIQQHPVDKDATDTALALAHAVEIPGATDLLVLAGAGDRLDHTVATLAALGNPALAIFETVRAVLGETTVNVLHPGHVVSIHAPEGTTFSLLALHGPCSGVNVEHARWPLSGADIAATATVGVSNLTLGPPSPPTHIAVGGGVLTVVIP
ncbi:MAG: thiamine diphosphokinase [Ilumatobacteraceae bacterium]